MQRVHNSSRLYSRRDLSGVHIPLAEKWRLLCDFCRWAPKGIHVAKCYVFRKSPFDAIETRTTGVRNWLTVIDLFLKKKPTVRSNLICLPEY